MIVFQYDDGKRECYATCMAQVRNKLPRHVGYTKISKTDAVPNCSDYRAASNIVRCDLACRNPDMLWLDADTIIAKWFDFEFEKDKVYFATGNGGRPENWCFFVNGRTDFFADMRDCYEKEKPDHIWWFARYVDTRKRDVALIPRGYVIHLMLSRAILAGDKFTESGNLLYTVKRNPVTEELTVEMR